MNMKRLVSEFLRRGAIACGAGPLILAAVYLVLHSFSVVQVLTVSEVCTGIFSLTALAFVVGGINVLYQIERLPLMAAILIHGGVLYLGYLGTYLLNDWLDLGVTPIIIFSAAFVVGYIIIWAVIYSVIRKNTARLNDALRKKQQGI